VAAAPQNLVATDLALWDIYDLGQYYLLWVSHRYGRNSH
jgi:hypothetical protein